MNGPKIGMLQVAFGAACIGFALGRNETHKAKAAVKVLAPNNRMLQRKVELLTLANQHYEYVIDNFFDDDVSPREYNETVRRNREFFNIVANS